jgi:hypothetical protein
VTSRALDQPLRAWLEELSRQTGVRLRLARDYEDRAITARVKDVPLDAVKDGIAALYGDVWKERGDDDAPVYELHRSEVRVSRQRRLLAAYRNSLGKSLVEIVRDVAANGPPPWLTEGGGEGDYPYAEELKARAKILSQLSPKAVDALLSGQTIRVRLGETRGAAGDALRAFAERFAMPDKSGWKPEDRAKAWVHFSAEPYALRHSGLRGLPLRDLHFTFGGPGGASSSYNLVMHPDTAAARIQRDLAALRAGEEQKPEERRRRGGPALLGRLPPAPEWRQGAVAPRSTLLVALAEAADFNLIADSHIKPAAPAPQLGGVTVEQALELACEAHASYWRAEPQVIMVRSRHWWLDDLAEPPASEMATWAKALAGGRALTLEESAAIAALTTDQQDRVALRLPEVWPVRNPLMRFYAVLSEEQRQAALSSKGVELWSVSEQQRRALFGSPRGGNLGRAQYEELIHSAAGVFKITPEAANAGAAALPTFTFRLQAVPDRTGRKRGAGVTMKITLPHREGRRKRADPGLAPPQ